MLFPETCRVTAYLLKTDMRHSLRSARIDQRDFISRVFSRFFKQSIRIGMHRIAFYFSSRKLIIIEDKLHLFHVDTEIILIFIFC